METLMLMLCELELQLILGGFVVSLLVWLLYKRYFAGPTRNVAKKSSSQPNKESSANGTANKSKVTENGSTSVSVKANEKAVREPVKCEKTASNQSNGVAKLGSCAKSVAEKNGVEELAVDKAVASVDNIVDALKQASTLPISEDKSSIAGVAARADVLTQAVSGSVLASVDVAVAAGADDEATEEIKEIAENIENIGSAVGDVANSVDDVKQKLCSVLTKPADVGSVVENLADLTSAVGETARATADLADAIGVDAEAAQAVEEATAAAVKAASLASGLVGALRGEDTEVKAAVEDVAQLSGQLVGALASGDVEGLLNVVESVGERATKLEALADELGCGDSVGAITGSVTIATNIITADHQKSAAIVGQAASDVGGALFGVLSAVGSAVIGGGDSDGTDGGSTLGKVVSASGDAARIIGESIGSVADLTDELGGKDNVVSNTIRELSEVNSAVGEVLSATGKAVTKIAAGEASAADVVALSADCLAGATHGVVAVAGSVVNEMNMAVGAVKFGANLTKAGFAVAGHFAKSMGLHEGAVDAVVGVVSTATDTVNVAASSVSGVLQATHDAVETAGDLVSAAGKAAVRVTEEGNGEASVTDVLAGMVSGVRENEADVGEAVSGITSASGAALVTALNASSVVAETVGLTAVGNAVSGLFGYGSSSVSEDMESPKVEDETTTVDIGSVTNETALPTEVAA